MTNDAVLPWVWDQISSNIDHSFYVASFQELGEKISNSTYIFNNHPKYSQYQITNLSIINHNKFLSMSHGRYHNRTPSTRIQDDIILELMMMTNFQILLEKWLQGVLGSPVVQPDLLVVGCGDGSGLERGEPLHHLLHLCQHLVHWPSPPHHGVAVPESRLHHCQEVSVMEMCFTTTQLTF